MAQFGRDVPQDVVEKLIGQFAECLEKEIMGENAREEPAAASTNGPVESFGEEQPPHGTIFEPRRGEPGCCYQAGVICGWSGVGKVQVHAPL